MARGTAAKAKKTGVDDFLVAGGTVAELKLLARPFDPADFARERLSRDESLRGAVAGLWEIWQEREWKGLGGYSRRDIMRAFIRAAARGGKVVAGGVSVKVSQRTLAEEAGTRQPTVSKSIPRLENEGLLKRSSAARAKDEAGSYVLLLPEVKRDTVTRVYHEGKKTSKREGLSLCPSTLTPSPPASPSSHTDTPLSRYEAHELERLRWSYVQRVRVPKGIDGNGDYAYYLLERLGKIRGHAVECLLAAGGRATVPELIRSMGRSDRPSRFKERVLWPLAGSPTFAAVKSAEGELCETYLRRVYGSPIMVVLDGDEVILAEGWREALRDAREMAGEYDAERRAREQHKLAREAYRSPDRDKHDEEPPMRPIDDTRQSWPRHPSGCACRECSERFGRVVGEHVANCRCGQCFAQRKRANGGRGRLVPLRPSPLQAPAALQLEKDTPAMLPMVSLLQEEPRASVPGVSAPEGDWRDHSLACECEACSHPEPRYAHPWSRATN